MAPSASEIHQYVPQRIAYMSSIAGVLTECRAWVWGGVVRVVRAL